MRTLVICVLVGTCAAPASAGGLEDFFEGRTARSVIRDVTRTGTDLLEEEQEHRHRTKERRQRHRYDLEEQEQDYQHETAYDRLQHDQQIDTNMLEHEQWTAKNRQEYLQRLARLREQYEMHRAEEARDYRRELLLRQLQQRHQLQDRGYGAYLYQRRTMPPPMTPEEWTQGTRRRPLPYREPTEVSPAPRQEQEDTEPEKPSLEEQIELTKARLSEAKELLHAVEERLDALIDEGVDPETSERFRVYQEKARTYLGEVKELKKKLKLLLQKKSD